MRTTTPPGLQTRRARRPALPPALACLLLGAAACTGETIGSPPPAPVDWHAFEVARTAPPPALPPTPRQRALAEAYVAALASPGFAALAPLLDSESHFSFPGTSDARGREAIVRAHEALLGGLEGRSAVATHIFRTAGAQIVEWTLTGTQAREWMGVAPSQKPAALRAIAVLTTKDDGVLSDLRVFFDTAVARALVGGGPKELAGLTAPPAPVGPPQIVEDRATPEEVANVSAAKAWLDLLERSSEAPYLAAATDDVVIETAQRAQPWKGKDDLKALYRSIHKSIGQLDSTVENSWGVGPFVVVEYAIAGEQIASLGWVPPQRNKVVRLHTVDVIELRDGKIAHVRRYDNPGEIVGSSH